MPFTIIIFTWRKPGTTPAEFKAHYENTHVPLIQSITGANFPLTHTRHYIQRVPGENASGDTSNAAYPAVTFAGGQEDFTYDAFAELVFEDAAKFQQFFACVSEPENAKRLQADEEKFLDRAKMTIASIDQVEMTRRAA